MSEIVTNLCVPHKPWRGKLIRVKSEGETITVTIAPKTTTVMDSEHADFGNELIEGYGVSWPSLGSVSPSKATDFKIALDIAVTEARLLENKHKGQKWR